MADLASQGGVNEKGLWFDAFSLPRQPVTTAQGEIYPGDLQDKLLAECATVAEVLEKLKRYSRAPMTRYQWMFGDRTGASVIIEADAIIPMRGPYQVVTNFRQSAHPDGAGYECERFRIANAMLEKQPRVGVDELRRLLAATHSEGQDPTVYSYIADLVHGVVYLYHFHDFENVVVLDVRKELAKGAHVYDLPKLFPGPTRAADFDYRARTELAAKKTARLYPRFDATTFADYAGVYRVTGPEILAGQTLTISAGASQLYVQLNGGREARGAPELGDLLLPARPRRLGLLVPVRARPDGEGERAVDGGRRAVHRGDARRVGTALAARAAASRGRSRGQCRIRLTRRGSSC